MLEEELTSIAAVLEGVAECIQDKDLKTLVSRCCGNLSAAAEQAQVLESALPTADMDLSAESIRASGMNAIGMTGEGR